jgi:hypothetical protein
MSLVGDVYDSAEAEGQEVIVPSDLSSAELERLADEIIALLQMELRLEGERLGCRHKA